MTRNRYVSIAALAVVALACSPPAQQQSPPDDAIPVASDEDLARVREVAGILGQELSRHLFSELERSGPIGAIEVCSRVAQETAATLSDEELGVRRVSRRFRNPADEPDAWELKKLDELERLAADGALPGELFSVEAEDSGHELRYLKPLVIAPPCLTCHGDVGAMDPALRERLGELYPEDRAVGYELGNLRGAVSVRLRLGSDRGGDA